jgi:hypothetical protein
MYIQYITCSSTGAAILYHFALYLVVLKKTMFAPQNLVAISSPECTNCEYSEPSIDDRLYFVLYEKEDTPKSTSYGHWLRSSEHETHERCPQCFS